MGVMAGRHPGGLLIIPVYHNAPTRSVPGSASFLLPRGFLAETPPLSASRCLVSHVDLVPQESFAMGNAPPHLFYSSCSTALRTRVFTQPWARQVFSAPTILLTLHAVFSCDSHPHQVSKRTIYAYSTPKQECISKALAA
jgi:hypothetical protein